MDALIHGLMQADAYDHPVRQLQLLETHISWVILTGDYAYKLKKPVDFGFVDFTTLPRRRHFCDEEIRLNRRLSPELYLQVRPIYGPREQPRLSGNGEPIEYAVQMRQFDQQQLLPEVLQRNELRVDQLDQLAETVATFHRHAAVARHDDDFGTPVNVRAAAFAAFDTFQGVKEGRTSIEPLRSWSEQEFERLADWFRQRKESGRVRECHGDMHLGNMVLLDDVVRIFDCLEFNPRLRWTDVIAEIAFLVMDLQERGRPDLSRRFLNRWLEQTGDYAGLTGWRWYFVYRALVRAKVAALRLKQPDLESPERDSKRQELQQYLALAQEWIGTRQPVLLVMHGLSGSGKSHVSERICEHFPAIRLRSDVERKRLFGQWGDPGTKLLTGDMYASHVTETVYREVLAEQVPRILNAGFIPLVDATCLRTWQRQVFQDLAAQSGVRCVILDVQAQPETLRKRIQQRQNETGEPSDADLAVLEQQLATHEPMSAGEKADSLIVDTESSSWWTKLEGELLTVLRDR